MITKHHSDKRDVSPKVKGSNASADNSFFLFLKYLLKITHIALLWNTHSFIRGVEKRLYCLVLPVEDVPG